MTKAYIMLCCVPSSDSTVLFELHLNVLQLHNKTLFYRFIYCVWEIILGFFSCEIKSCFQGNKVVYVLRFGKCGKIQFLIKFEFTHFFL